MGRLRISVNFSDLLQWDVKQFFAITVKSKYIVEKLGKHLSPETEKFEIRTLGEKLVGILGVSNKQGMFDAETTKACNISQKYHRVDNDWLAYNPYRVNVGSIGLKTIAQKGEYISPAYVVFSCKRTILPEYIYRLAKTQQFNKLIRNSTTGTVRQTLSFEKLSEIEAPIPPIAEQRKILDEYNRLKLRAETLYAENRKIKEDIKSHINSMLKIKYSACEKKETILQTVLFSQLSRWDVDYNLEKVSVDSTVAMSPLSKFIESFMQDKDGKGLGISTSKYPKSEFCYIGMDCVEKNTGIVAPQKIIGKEVLSNTVRVPKGYLLYGKLRPYLNKYWYNNTDNENIVCSGEFFVYNLKNNIHRDYYTAILASDIVQSQISALCSGTDRPRLSKDDFMQLVIPEPSIEAQKQIADYILQQNKKIAANIAEAEKCNAHADKYFESAVFE